MASVIFTGVMLSSRLKKREVFLCETVMFISQVSMEIEFVSLPLFEILKKIARGDCCKSLDFIPMCIENRKRGDDFSLCWETAVEGSSLPLKKEERQKLKSLSGLLGTSDVSGQKNMLSLYSSYFTAYYEKAVKEHEKYGKMCVTLSVVMGTGIFILLI